MSVQVEMIIFWYKKEQLHKINIIQINQYKEKKQIIVVGYVPTTIGSYGLVVIACA